MNLTSDQIVELFRKTGAYLEGHFRLTSGLHSPNYLQCALVLQHPRSSEQLGSMLAERLRQLARPAKIDLVVSPAIGGLIIGQEVARSLGCPHIFAERQDGQMTLRRGFTVTPGQRAVVVEDVVTTGGSSREVIQLLRESGAEPVAAGSVIDRSGGKADVGLPRAALVTLQVIAYPPDDCPLCREGRPVVKPGSRAGA